MDIRLYTPQSIHEMGKRQNQEDSLFPAIGSATSSDRVFVLCDGMGGYERGEVASQTVCASISSYMKNHWPKNGVVDDQLVRSAVNAAYHDLDGKGVEGENMGTTLTLLVFHAGGCTAAHIGDSRIYHFRPSERRMLYRSRDHSLVFDLYMAGEISYSEMKTSPKKNIITKAMQPGEDNRYNPDIVHIGDVRPGDYFYLCSDGMLERMEDDQILQILCEDRSDAEKCRRLVAETEGNSDNRSAHLIHIQNVSRKEGELIPDDEATSRFNVLNNHPKTVDAIEIEQEEVTQESAAAPVESPQPFLMGKRWLWLAVAVLVLVVILALLL